MGILNSTPDSYYVPSRKKTFDEAINHGIQLWRDGADIIDIGGESTRPNAEKVSEEEELKRVIPLIKELSKLQPLPISIDTMKPTVAEKALAAGASIINDVSGFRDPNMRELAAASQAKICVMHMQGSPQSMQDSPYYKEGVVVALLHWFETILEDLAISGIKNHQIILDPGIGFGKTVADNLEIIHNLRKFKAIGFPLLLGISRKSFIQKILGLPSTDVLPATLAISSMAIVSGVDYIRVHDVKEHRQAISILEKYEST